LPDTEQELDFSTVIVDPRERIQLTNQEQPYTTTGNFEPIACKRSGVKEFIHYL